MMGEEPHGLVPLALREADVLEAELSMADDRRDVIVVRLQGDLGSQMFTYATGGRLAGRLETDLVLDNELGDRRVWLGLKPL
jgi:hypothetical protein